MRSLIRLLAALGTAALTGLIILAIWQGDFSSAGAWLTTRPWGRVTLFDLYFGFLISAVLIAAVERDWRSTLFWVLPVFVLGNVWTGIWLCIRARRVLSLSTRSGRTHHQSPGEP
ncbi:MAG: hypothetical protein ACJAU5_000464 [Maricaulis maris]|jgi:hypothetical protein|uniref:DUF1475 domain-containing protein n=1 Tax=Maricaulis maris (strain MCS10) TaxID=394221 RepID=Q0AKM0_MARMM|nr:MULTISPECIES: hypothetical protein [Maricaulis]ABI67173.1 hypothetical protein Mmar10_2892 [Maricaulis maris MCS10]MAC89489.1 hypothetical protein [Maricaulis sp.]